MTTLTQVQEDQASEALTDEELESVDGGIDFDPNILNCLSRNCLFVLHYELLIPMWELLLIPCVIFHQS